MAGTPRASAPCPPSCFGTQSQTSRQPVWNGITKWANLRNAIHCSRSRRRRDRCRDRRPYLHLSDEIQDHSEYVVRPRHLLRCDRQIPFPQGGERGRLPHRPVQDCPQRSLRPRVGQVSAAAQMRLPGAEADVLRRRRPGALSPPTGRQGGPARRSGPRISPFVPGRAVPSSAPSGAGCRAASAHPPGSTASGSRDCAG